jgi:Cof subfamily protein (haloacid dehalogenase superfamily)
VAAFDLVVLDLDGTLLHGRAAVAPDLAEAIRGAIARGCAVTLATGRMPQAARPHWERLGVRAPVILYNGGLVLDPGSGRTLSVTTLPPGLPWALYPVYANAPVDPLFYREDRLFCLLPTLAVRAYSEETGVEAEPIPEPEAFLQLGAFNKCLFIGHPVDLATLREELDPLAAGAGRLVLSRANYLELIPRGVSKGEALRVVAGHLGIPLARTLAVGDQENDLEMLEAAGLGVAVASSPPAVRARAGRVAPPPEAGGLLAVLAELCPEHFG